MQPGHKSLSGCSIRFTGAPVSDERCGRFGESGVKFGYFF